MNSRIYRCGWCDTVTDSTGTLLRGDVCKRVQDIITMYGDSHTVKVNGDCCPNGDESQHSQQVQVTRDMAMDAGDLSLEGQWIDW